jgi:hypothetical protein
MRPDDEELLYMLRGAGLPSGVIKAHLPTLRRFSVELKAQELQFWGEYFIRSGQHYRQRHREQYGEMNDGSANA